MFYPLPVIYHQASVAELCTPIFYSTVLNMPNKYIDHS